MELRNHPLMAYRSIHNWPPVWTADSAERNRSRPTGEVGILIDVAPSKIEPHSKCFLTIEHQGISYTACLQFDDGPFCQRIHKLLQRYRHYPIEYIGGIDLRYTL